MGLMQAATVSQKRFAQGLALGKPATVAYKLAYPNAKGKRAGVQARATKAKKNPKVQAELQRLLADPILQPLVCLPCPEYQDYNKLIEHAVGVMIRLTTHSDPLVQFHSALWLFEYGKALKEDKLSKVKDSREKILADLRGIYAKSLPNPKLIVQDAVDAEPVAAGPEASETSEAAGEDTGWTPVDQDDEEPGPDGPEAEA